jgi:hypothetical protein
MATQFAHSLAPSAPLPFLLGKPRLEKPAPSIATSPSIAAGPSFAAALRTAVAAERAHGEIRNPRQRIALFLCELGKAYGCRSELPLSRGSLAGALGISLVRVKRTLALLSLSGVISTDGDTIRVLDWRKLSGAARFDASALGLAPEDEEEVLLVLNTEEDHLLTACGEPACFV